MGGSMKSLAQRMSLKFLSGQIEGEFGGEDEEGLDEDAGGIMEEIQTNAEELELLGEEEEEDGEEEEVTTDNAERQSSSKRASARIRALRGGDDQAQGSESTDDLKRFV